MEKPIEGVLAEAPGEVFNGDLCFLVVHIRFEALMSQMVLARSTRAGVRRPLPNGYQGTMTMYKYLLAVVAVLVAINAEAEVFKCKGVDGKVQFSDTACKAGNSSEVIPDRAPVSPQQQYEAQQRTLQMQNEAAAMDGSRAAARSEQTSPSATQDSEAAKKAAANQSARDADAVANCVRDVERRGASQNEKATMIAACRTAGSAQRSTGLSEDAVSNCVKSVERTGASEKEKVRQIALCHGGDVPPVVVQHPGGAASVK